MHLSFATILIAVLFAGAWAGEASAQQPGEAPTVAPATQPNAQPDPRRAQVDAAVLDAVNRLYAEIAATPISNKFTAGQLMDRTGGEPAMRRVLQHAEQIGGTRWIDDQTPQVRLEIDGESVVSALIAMAKSHPHDLPTSMPLDAIQVKLTPWRSRTFAATGTSTGQVQAVRLRPDPSNRVWSVVSDQDRRAAITAARANAVGRVLESVGSVEIASGKTIADAQRTPAIDQALRGWLQNRPVVAIEFRDDLEVRLSLAAQPEDFFTVLADALKQAHDSTPIPQDEAGWNRLHQQIATRMAPAIGRGAVGPGTAGASHHVSLIPTDPPAWVTDSLDSEAVAQSSGRLLRTARVAESAADDRLRARLDTLLLSPGLSLGEAAKQEPAIHDALDRSMRRARVYKVDYNEPSAGSVRVRVSISLEDVWRELNSR